MGSRHSKQEIFEPTLHTASRQTSTDTPACTQNDILTPYFEALQKETVDIDRSSQSESSILCVAADDPAQEQASNMVVQSASVPPLNPYDDIPFKLSPALVVGQAAGDLSVLCASMVEQKNSTVHRYKYDFQLERGVIRETQN